MSVGTPPYMSPEQATGDHPVGPRSDVYALGCVAYEMLTGAPPYAGSSLQAVLGKIMQGAPVSVTDVRPRVPANVDAAIRRAIERLPADRFQTADELAGALNAPTYRYGVAAAVDVETVARWRRRAQLLTGALLVMTALAGWGLLRPGPEPDRTATRVRIGLPAAQALGAQHRFDLSRDGSFMVYQGPVESGTARLWLRRWDQLDATQIPGTEAESTSQGSFAGASIRGSGSFFAISPDGDPVAVVNGNTLRVVPLVGGTPRSVAEDAWFGPGWRADGHWIYYTSVQNSGLLRVPAGGGPSEAVTELDPTLYDGHFSPRAVAAEDFLLVEVSTRTEDSVAVVDPGTGRVRTLFAGEYPRYSPSGHILFAVPHPAGPCSWPSRSTSSTGR